MYGRLDNHHESEGCKQEVACSDMDPAGLSGDTHQRRQRRPKGDQKQGRLGEHSSRKRYRRGQAGQDNPVLSDQVDDGDRAQRDKRVKPKIPRRLGRAESSAVSYAKVGSLRHFKSSAAAPDRADMINGSPSLGSR